MMDPVTVRVDILHAPKPPKDDMRSPGEPSSPEALNPSEPRLVPLFTSSSFCPVLRGRGPPADTQQHQAYGEVDADNTPKLMSIHVTDIDIKIMLAHYRLLAAVYAE
jgi:hypothetical protein